MKEIKSNSTHKFKIETWESNKGQLGFMAWALWLWIPELEHWYKLDGSHRYYPLHPTNCDRIANQAFKDALDGGYAARIQLVLGDGEN